MQKKGLEPSWCCHHTDLNRARLPIPPLLHFTLLSASPNLFGKMRKMGLEPTRYCYHKILSLARLPIPTLPQTHRADIILALLPTDVNSIFRIFYKLYQKL